MNEDDKFEQIVQRLESQGRLIRTWDLPGGVSAAVTALEFESLAGHVRRAVVRRYSEADLSQHPQVAADEFRLLRMLHGQGLAVPKPFFFDDTSVIFPRPYLVIEFVTGETMVSSGVPQVSGVARTMAEHLARIHEVTSAGHDLSFLPRQDRLVPEVLRPQTAATGEATGEASARRTLAATWPLPRRNTDVLLHGDYWPGNVLWKDDRLTAIIDWEDAAVGDPLADVANARLEMWWFGGSDAMQTFTARYRSLTAADIADLPYWDLYVALRAAIRLDDWTTDRQRQMVLHEGRQRFLAQALARLGLEGFGSKDIL